MNRRNPKTDPRPGDVLALGPRAARRKRVEVVKVAPHTRAFPCWVYFRSSPPSLAGGCPLRQWMETTRCWSVEHVAREPSVEQGRLL